MNETKEKAVLVAHIAATLLAGVRHEHCKVYEVVQVAREIVAESEKQCGVKDKAT